jgi:amino acid transporter
LPERIKATLRNVRRILDFLFGRPLANYEDKQEKIGPVAGIPVYGLDALSSAAYGPEAALTILIPLGAAGLRYISPITGIIVVLLIIVYLSYYQTIAAYPQGGGSYTVAKENMGARVGVLAAAALMIDYVLNVAVGISAGVGALVSAAPSLQPHTLALCLGILALLTMVNLRGMREAGAIFILPTYAFVICLLIAIVWGIARSLASGGHPVAAIAPPRPKAAAEAVSAWLLLKAFAGGCTAMTGVEAVSNGVPSFRDDRVKNARLTLTMIIVALVVLLIGIASIVRAYGITAAPPGQAEYQSILSMMLSAVAGRGWFYYVSIGSILSVLVLSANTSFAGFPQLCGIVARDRFLPFGFSLRGRRLVHAQPIYVLAGLSGLLLIVFGGITDRLIPLFAVGAFLAFTLSQAGMVLHWLRKRGHAASLAMNAIGATATGLTVLIVMVAKFTEGAWMTLILIPALVLLMFAIGKHYRRVGREVAASGPIPLDNLERPVVFVPVDSWDKVALKALRFALSLSCEVKALHIDAGEKTDDLRQRWDEWAKAPAERAQLEAPELVVLKSPFRYVVTPIYDYILLQKERYPGRKIAVIVSELVERRWYHYLLHNQRGEALTALLMLTGDPQIVVMNVPWYSNV